MFVSYDAISAIAADKSTGLIDFFSKLFQCVDAMIAKTYQDFHKLLNYYRNSQHAKRNPVLREEMLTAGDTLFALWWECLKESEDYAAALRGERGEPFASMARDFGDLNVRFVEWWYDTGRLLFADQVFRAPVAEAYEVSERPEDVQTDTFRYTSSSDEMTVWRDRARPNLYLRIPITLDRREIMRQVGEEIDRVQQLRAAEIRAAQQPRRTLYPDQRLSMSSIIIMLCLLYTSPSPRD